MQAKDWHVCVIEPNKFEGQIIVDILRAAGCQWVRVFTDSERALEALANAPVSLIIASVEAQPVDGVSWTRTLRRDKRSPNRKRPIFLTSRAFSRGLAEDCRHAGVNALIGKPLSSKTLITTINKVLGAPRPFIDAQGYVGPCRRAGIVTAGPAQKRRSADGEAGAAEQMDLDTLIEGLRAAADLFTRDGSSQQCAQALRKVQAYAVNASDGPLMRACAAFSLHLGAAKGLLADAAKDALDVCVAGVADLAATANDQGEKRESIAEGVRQAVAKAATLKAA